MDIVLRATVMFFVLFLLIRLLGKRELGQMTPFELPRVCRRHRQAGDGRVHRREQGLRPALFRGCIPLASPG
jgi:hypothetical protein